MALTKVSTPAIKDEAITLAKLLHGDSNSNGKFLRGNNGADPSFETITGTTINNNADNRVITGSGTANTLNGESNLVFDGTNLGLGAVASGAASIGQDKLDIRGGGIYLNSQSTATSGAINKISFLKLHPSAPSVSYEQGRIEAYTENGYGAGGLDFYYGKSVGGGNYAATKGLRLDHKGNLALGGFATPTDLNSAVEPSLFIDSTTNSLSAEGAAVYLTQNAYFNNGGSYEYVNAAAASQYRQNAGGHSFLHAASGSAGANFTFTEKLRIDSDGLKFNGDTAAANALDDYEEGTFTPQLRTANDATQASYAQRGGVYTKIGNMVHWVVRIDCSAAPSQGSSVIQVHNLPFNAQDWGGLDWPGNCILSYYSGFQNMGSTTNVRFLGPKDNASFVRMHGFNNTGDQSVNSLNTVGNNLLIILGGTYFAT